MLCDIIIDKGDGVKDRVFSDIDPEFWSIRQWYGLYSVFKQTFEDTGFAKIIIVPNKVF